MPRAQKAWLLSHHLNLGDGQPRGEGVDPVPNVPVVGVEEAWLAGVSQDARQESGETGASGGAHLRPWRWRSVASGG